MPTLLIHIERETPRRLPLSPGKYSLGRDRSNSIRIDADSVSGRHCELTVFADGQAVVRDAGSTNGTFVDGVQVGVGALLPGQVLSLGDVPLSLESDSMAGRDFVEDGGAIEIARSNGQASGPAIADKPGYWAAVTGAFGYPLKGNGWVVLAWLIVLQFIFLLLPPIIRPVIQPIAWIFGALAGMYLFHLGLEIISTSAQGGDHWPSTLDLPWLKMDRHEIWEMAAKYVLLGLFCFGPATVVRFFPDAPMWVSMAMAAAGAVYFPMALLAVILADRLAAASPTVVIPSIQRTFGSYSIVVLMLWTLLAIESLVERAGTVFAGVPWVSGLIQFAAGAVGLYLLLVWLRTLGLFYRHHRESLAWDLGEE